MEQILLISSLALWILVILNLLLTLGLARRINTALPKQDRLKPGQKAPDFTAQTIDGQTLRLADFAGRALALIFFSPDCSTCREILVDIKQLKPIATQVGAELVLVGDHETDSLRSYTQNLDLDLPILSAPRRQNSFTIDYKMIGVPSYCVIDSQGKVRSTGFGELEDIEQVLFSLQGKEVLIEKA